MKHVMPKHLEKKQSRPNALLFGLAAAALPALILLFTYLVRGLLLRGSTLLLYSELDSEYLALIRLLKDPSSAAALLPSASLSEMARTAVFAASPLNHLIALAPLSSAGVAVALVSVLRAALSGLTFSLYLREKRLPPYARLAFSTMYALSSYAVLMTYSITYIDTLILFPLIMLGIEKLVNGRRIALFACALTLALLTNPFALAPLLLSSIVYGVYLSVLRAKSARERLWDASCFLLSALVACAASAVVLFPIFSSLKPNPGAYHFTTVLDILDFFAKALPGSYDGAADAHLPYFFVGVAPLLLIPVYFSSSRIPKRERIATGVLWFLLYFTFSIHSVNGAWSGFVPALPTYANALFFTFLFLSAAQRAFTVLDSAAERTLLISAGILTVLVSVIQKLDLSYTISGEDGKQSVEYVSDVPALWLSLLFTVLLVAVLVLLSRGKDGLSQKGKRIAAAALLLTVSFEAFASASEMIKLIDGDEGYLKRNEFSVYERASSAGASLLADSPLYRFELTDRRTELDPLLYRYPSLLDYDRSVLAALGIHTDENGAVTDTDAPLMLSLLGVRYFIERETFEACTKEGDPMKDSAPRLSKELSDRYLRIPLEGEKSAPHVYENENTLPLLFLGSPRVGDVVFSSTVTPFETFNSVFSALTEGSTTPYVAAKFTERTSEISKQVAVDGYTVYEKTPKNGYMIEYRVTAETDGPLYLSLFTLYPRAATVEVTASSVANQTLFEASEDRTVGTVCLGKYSKGDSITVKLNFEKSSDARFYIPKESTLFWQEDSASAEAAFDALSSRTLSNLKVDRATLSGTVTSKAGELLFTSLPNDGGWVVRVDGKLIEPSIALGCFLTIPLGDEGTHTVSLSRTPAVPSVSIPLTSVGIALLVFAAVIESYARKTRRALPYFPEKTIDREAGKL